MCFNLEGAFIHPYPTTYLSFYVFIFTTEKKKKTNKLIFVLFCFWLHQWHVEALGPGLEPVPQW